MTLNIEGLTVRYRTPDGDVTALADVSLALAQLRYSTRPQRRGDDHG